MILIDHLKQVHIEGELEPLDTPVWYARMLRKDYSIGMNVQGVGIDDPDVVFYETFACGSERNYTQYCNPELEKLFHQQSQMTDFEKRRALVWEIDRKLQEDGARPVISHGRGGTCWQPSRQGREHRRQHDIQPLALRARLDRQVGVRARRGSARHTGRAVGDIVEGERHGNAAVVTHQGDDVGDADMSERLDARGRSRPRGTQRAFDSTIAIS